jgi:hypothetical protein
MPELPLAIGIADAIATAKERDRSSLDVKSKAKLFVKVHPEAGVSAVDMEAVLYQESVAAGIVPISEPDEESKATLHPP